MFNWFKQKPAAPTSEPRSRLSFHADHADIMKQAQKRWMVFCEQNSEMVLKDRMIRFASQEYQRYVSVYPFLEEDPSDLSTAILVAITESGTDSAEEINAAFSAMPSRRADEIRGYCQDSN